MRRTLAIVGIAVLLLSLMVVAGCKEKQENVACAGCGMEVAKADARMIDGKPYCSHCADKMQQTAMHTCPDCGMEMAEKEMVQVEGKWYCPHCADKHRQEEGGGHQHEGGEHDDHG